MCPHFATTNQQCNYLLPDRLGYFNTKDKKLFGNIYLKSRTIICSFRSLHQTGRSTSGVMGLPLGKATLQVF
jgi:hypothetical protein